MSNIIQGVKVNGTVYKYDYESLENLPDPELPAADSAVDVGKVLTVDDSGLPSWETPPSGLPSSSGSDSGKALIVNNTGNPAWDTILPAYSSHDEGKVLVLGSSTLGHGTVGPQWGSALPTGSSIGFALVIDSTGSPAWKDLKYPACGSQDRGKTLVVNTTGEPVWSELLPTHDTSYDGSDVGKALIVATNGELKWDEASLPDTSDASGGDVLILTVGDCGHINLGWGSPFPYYDTIDDEGKVLTVTSSGLRWNSLS